MDGARWADRRKALRWGPMARKLDDTEAMKGPGRRDGLSLLGRRVALTSEALA